MSEILKRLPDENINQYIWRVGQAKDSGLLTGTWEMIAPTMNVEMGYAEEDALGESAIRKRYRTMQQSYDDVFSKMQFADDYHDNIIDSTKELYKAKKQYEDQRRECRKLWAEEARFDNLTDKLIDSVNKMRVEQPLEFIDKYVPSGDSEALLIFNDWHYGMTTDNIWNKYDTNICRQRVVHVIVKTISYLKRHNVKTLHIALLGDAAHGSAHCTCRVESDEYTCDQIMHVSEIIAEAVNDLSQYVDTVKVYSAYGNHLRTVQNKNDSIHGDNMERLIPWWLEQRLQSNNRVEIIKSEYYEFLHINIFGYNIVGAHGDLEKFKQFGITVNTLFNKKYNLSIDYTISADKHHLEEFEQFGIESILARSLCGTDEYANNGRLYSDAGQTLMIFSRDEGRECTYNIKF